MSEALISQAITGGAVVLAGLGGYVLAGVNESKRDRRTAVRERKLRFEDRLAAGDAARHEFQLATLLELQDALQLMARLTGKTMHFDHMQARKESYTQLPPEYDAEMLANGTDVIRLRNRILDGTLRGAIDAFEAASVAATISPKVYEGKSGRDLEDLAERRPLDFNDSYNSVMAHLGEGLRREIEWSPTPAEA